MYYTFMSDRNLFKLREEQNKKRMKRSFILPPPVIHTVCFYFSDEGLSDSLWYDNKRQKAIFHLVKDGLLERKTRSFAFQKAVFLHCVS